MEFMKTAGVVLLSTAGTCFFGCTLGASTTAGIYAATRAIDKAERGAIKEAEEIKEARTPAATDKKTRTFAAHTFAAVDDRTAEPQTFATLPRPELETPPEGYTAARRLSDAEAAELAAQLESQLDKDEERGLNYERL